jgi:hypothetical protein
LVRIKNYKLTSIALCDLVFLLYAEESGMILHYDTLEEELMGLFGRSSKKDSAYYMSMTEPARHGTVKRQSPLNDAILNAIARRIENAEEVTLKARALKDGSGSFGVSALDARGHIDGSGHYGEEFEFHCRGFRKDQQTQMPMIDGREKYQTKMPTIDISEECKVLVWDWAFLSE